jgi:hypothetical protein
VPVVTAAFLMGCAYSLKNYQIQKKICHKNAVRALIG